jgi:hypothetical protein
MESNKKSEDCCKDCFYFKPFETITTVLFDAKTQYGMCLFYNQNEVEEEIGYERGKKSVLKKKISPDKIRPIELLRRSKNGKLIDFLFDNSFEYSNEVVKKVEDTLTGLSHIVIVYLNRNGCQWFEKRA